MTRDQRRVLGAVGGVIAVVLLAWAVAAAAGDGDGEEVTTSSRAPETSTTVPPTTDTTLPLVPVTGGVAIETTTTLAPSPTTPGTTAAPTTTEQGLETVTGTGAFLTRPATETTRPVDKAKGCYSAVDAGWRIVECGALKRDDAVLLWLVEARGKGLRVLVLREQTAGQWATVLAAFDDDGTKWSRIGVRGEDASGDGRPDLLVGFHERSAGNALVIDLVEAGTVTVHRGLPGGSARPAKGELHTWAAVGDGTFRHETLRVIAGGWRVAAREQVAAGAVPPSMV